MSERNICLLGFSKRTEDKLRAIIKENNKISEINWVPANSQLLDAVVINSQHLENPQIKKFISITTCPCVCAYTNTSKPESTKLMSLNIDEPSQTDQLWFSILLGSSYAVDENLITTYHDKKPKEKEPNKPSSFDKTLNQTLEISGTGDLLDIITKQEYRCILASYNNNETIIYPKEEVVFIDYPRESIAGINLWHWKICPSPTNSDRLRKMKLEQWLFESIWQANDQSYSVENNKKFNLVKWPQPLSKQGRTEALRIAAVIKIAPASIAEILSKTQYSRGVIERFLYAGIISKQIAVSDDEGNDNKIYDRKIDNANDQEIQKKKTLLGRLRSKLGLG